MWFGGTCHQTGGQVTNLIAALHECKINKQDAVMFGKNKQKFQNASVIVLQVSSENTRDRSLTLSQDSRPFFRQPETKVQART